MAPSRGPPPSPLQLWPLARICAGAGAAVLLASRVASAADAACTADVASVNVTVGAAWHLPVVLHEDLPDGANESFPCRSVHRGYSGAVSLSCSAGGLSADASACLRSGCLEPDRFARRADGEIAIQEMSVDGLPVDYGSPLWTGFARTGDGSLVAAPACARQALAVSAGAGAVRSFGDLGDAPLKYRSVVAAAPGPAEVVLNGAPLGELAAAYGVPFFADRVLRIDAGAPEGPSALAEVGPGFGIGSSKWFGGASLGGAVWAMPYNYAKVLRIDLATQGSSTATVGPDLGLGESKWWEAVVVMDRVLGIPCDASSMLLIDPATAAVSTFGGPLGGARQKWSGAAALPGSGLVYAVPHGHRRVLRVSVEALDASLIGPDFGVEAGKWSGAVLAPDGSIFGIPHAAREVLRIEPHRGDAVRAIGPALPAGQAWSQGALGAGGRVVGLPSVGASLLIVDPVTEDVQIQDVAAAAEDGRDGKWAGAALGADGVVYCSPGARPTVLRIAEASCLLAPEPVDAMCSLGEPCAFRLRGADGVFRAAASALLVVRGAAHCGDAAAVPVPEIQGWENPAVAAEVVAGEAAFDLGAAVEGLPSLSGRFRICLGDGPTSEADYTQDIGFLTLAGPVPPKNASCVLGLPCVVELPGGLGLLPSDELAIVGMPSEALAVLEGVVNPATVGEASATSFDLGTIVAPMSGPAYALRWGRGGRGVWLVRLGGLELVGPRAVGGGNLRCSLGARCNVVVEGFGLLSCDVVALVPLLDGGCGNASSGAAVAAGWCGLAAGDLCPASVADDVGDSEVFELGAATSFEDIGAAPRFAICWGSTAGAPPRVEVGVLELLGPVVAAAPAVCRLGVLCAVAVRGYGLAAGDALAVVAGPCRPAGAAAYAAGQLADLGAGVANPLAAPGAAGAALTFDLGAPQRGAGATYRLCWEPAAARLDHAAVEVGLLELLANDCVPPAAVPHAADPPCAEGPSIPHGGVCTPSCQPFHDANVSALACSAGSLLPDTFACVPRCVGAPLVAGASAQSQCANLAHGATCSLSCPDGFTPSGDFACDRGVLVHRANPALPGELVYDAPRCYRPCAASAFPSPPNAAPGAPCGGAPAPHGGACAAACAEGFTAHGVDGPMAQLRCRDGAFEPATFQCIARCRAPSVAHAVGLERCDGVPHGAACELLCEAGYRKTSDLYCDRGVFSPAACRAPCDLRRLLPEGVANASGAMCVGVGSDLVLYDGQKCAPDCLPGFSNLLEDTHPVCRDGALLPATATCQADCPQPPPFGFVRGAADLSASCAGLRHGEECELICSQHHTPEGGPVRCVDGAFTAGLCRRQCTTLPPIEGALLLDHCYALPHGASCEVRCAPPYLATGKSATCIDGDWSSEGICLRPCPASDVPPPSGEGAPANTTCAEGRVVAHGEACSFQCAAGFESNVQATCVSGKLDPAAYLCRPRGDLACGPPDAVLGIRAAAACAGTAHGSACRAASCAEGFRQAGVLRCEFGKWNSPCVDLREHCGAAYPDVPNGNVAASCAGDDVVGSRCPVECDGGFGPGPIDSLECLAGGSWSSGARCIRLACGLPASLPHGRSTCNGRATYADRCEVTCDDGYGSDGSLLCVSDGAGGVAWAALPTVAGTALCAPLPCGSSPLVPGLSAHTCDGTLHGGVCGDFVCSGSLIPAGAFRCHLGRFVELPSCLSAEHGVAVAVPAVVFSVTVELFAAWGDLQPSNDWGVQAQNVVAESLRRALVDEGEALEVVVLGWTARSVLREGVAEEVGGGGAGGARRLAMAAVALDMSAAVAAASVTGGAVATAGAATMALVQDVHGRASALTPSALDALAVGLPPLLGSGGKVGIAFADIGAPSFTSLARPAAPPAATATSTTTPPPAAEATTAAPSAPPAAAAAPTDDEGDPMAFLTPGVRMLVGAAVAVPMLVCFCCYLIRHQGGRLRDRLARGRGGERKQNGPLLDAPQAAMSKDAMVQIATVDAQSRRASTEVKQAKQCQQGEPGIVLFKMSPRRETSKPAYGRDARSARGGPGGDGGQAARSEALAKIIAVSPDEFRTQDDEDEEPKRPRLDDCLRDMEGTAGLAHIKRSQAHLPKLEIEEGWFEVSPDGHSDYTSLELARDGVLERPALHLKSADGQVLNTIERGRGSMRAERRRASQEQRSSVEYRSHGEQPSSEQAAPPAAAEGAAAAAEGGDDVATPAPCPRLRASAASASSGEAAPVEDGEAASDEPPTAGVDDDDGDDDDVGAMDRGGSIDVQRRGLAPSGRALNRLHHQKRTLVETSEGPPREYDFQIVVQRRRPLMRSDSGLSTTSSQGSHAVSRSKKKDVTWKQDTFPDALPPALSRPDPGWRHGGHLRADLTR